MRHHQTILLSIWAVCQLKHWRSTVQEETSKQQHLSITQHGRVDASLTQRDQDLLALQLCPQGDVPSSSIIGVNALLGHPISEAAAPVNHTLQHGRVDVPLTQRDHDHSLRKVQRAPRERHRGNWTRRHAKTQRLNGGTYLSMTRPSMGESMIYSRSGITIFLPLELHPPVV